MTQHMIDPIGDQILTALSQIATEVQETKTRVDQMVTTTNRAFILVDTEQTDLQRQQERDGTAITELRFQVNQFAGIIESLRVDLVEQIRVTRKELAEQIRVMRAEQTQEIRIVRDALGELTTNNRLLNEKYHQVSNYVAGQEGRIAEVADGIAALVEAQGATDAQFAVIDQAHAAAATQRGLILDHQADDRRLLIGAVAGSYAAVAALAWFVRRGLRA